MRQPPRAPDEPVLTRRHWLTIGAWSIVVAACMLGAFAVAHLQLGFDQPAAVTVSFLTLGFAKLWFVFNLRERGSRLLDNEIVRNPWIWGAIALCGVLLLAAVYLPGLAGVLETERLPASGWALLLTFSAAPLVIGQLILTGAYLAHRPKDG